MLAAGVTGRRSPPRTERPATPICVIEYQASWPQLYRAEAESLVAAVGAHLIAREHIGSTAVPGLPAKPVIDILAELRTRQVPRDVRADRSRSSLSHRTHRRDRPAAGPEASASRRNNLSSLSPSIPIVDCRRCG